MSTKISVISATLNAVESLPRLYDSLRTQGFQSFEWIVADGGSSDGTVDLLKRFATNSPWLRYSSEPDFGVYHALNRALGAAEGDYYVVAGADDFFNEGALQNFADSVADNATDVVLANVVRKGHVVGGYFPRKAWIGTSHVFGTSHSCGILLRRNLHERYGLYTSRFPLLADVHFLKVLLRSNAVTFREADFVSGVFGDMGMTSVRKLQILAENWQIQMLTEPHPGIQTALFIGKIALKYRSVVKELRQLRRRARTESITR